MLKNTYYIKFITLIFVIWLNRAYSQFQCQLLGNGQSRWESYESEFGIVGSDDLSIYDPSGDRYYIGIALHIITDDNGSGGVLESDLQSGLLILENALNQANIGFIVVKRDTISDDEYIETTIEEEEILYSQYGVSDAVNIFYIPSPTDNLSTFSPEQQSWLNGWYSSSTECAREGNYILMQNDNAGASTMGHEIGHYFDLFHIYEKMFDFEGNTSQYTSGDLLYDTPITQHEGGGYCDGQGEHLIKAENFMNGNTTCRSKFTSEQVKKIRYVLNTRRSSHLKPWIQFSNMVSEVNAGGEFLIAQYENEWQTTSGSFLQLFADVANVTSLNERFINIFGLGRFYKHNNWNDVNSDFLIKHDFIAAYNEFQSANYNTLYDAEITNTTNEDIKFKDPWYIHSDDEQHPDSFVVFSSPYFPTGKYNEYEGGVFLNREPDPNNLDLPYYSVCVPVLNRIGSIHNVFNRWQSNPIYAEIWDDPVAINEPNQKAVVFRDDGAQVVAKYFKNITLQNCTLYYLGEGELLVKAPQYYADENGIYEFVQWAAADSVTFVSPYNKSSKIIFSGGYCTIQPVYDSQSIFDKTSPPDEVVITDNLTVPPGAIYGIPTNTTLKVNGGNLVISGTAENPVVLGVREPPLPKAASGSGQWPGIEIVDGKLTVRHAVIKDAGIGIYANYADHDPGPVKIHNCTFANNEKGIEWYDPMNQLTYNYIDIRNCIFYNITEQASSSSAP